MEVRIVLKLRATRSAPATTYGGRVIIPVLQPLGFGN
jgi:hypothetical protein